MSLSYTQRRLIETKHARFGMMTTVDQLRTFLAGFGRVFTVRELSTILNEEGIEEGEVIPLSVCLTAVRRHRPRSTARAEEMEAFVAYGGRQDGSGEAEDPSDTSRAVPLQAFKERFRERLAGGVGARTSQPSLYADLTSGTPRAGEELVGRRKGIKHHAKRIKTLNRVVRTESIDTSDTASTVCSSSRGPVTGLIREEAEECVERHSERVEWMQGAIGQLLTFKSMRRPVALEMDGRMRKSLRRPTSALGRSLVPSLVEREAMKLERQISALRSELSTTSPSNASSVGATKRVSVLPNADQLVRRVARSRPQSASAVRPPPTKVHRLSVLAPHVRRPIEYKGPIASADDLRAVIASVLSPLPMGHAIRECYIVCGQDGDVRISADTFPLLPTLCDVRVVTGVPESSSPQ